MIKKSDFKPAWWLKNAHAQTIFRGLVHRKKVHITAAERLELPDGDFIDLAWATHGVSPDAPLVIFLHGLGGDLNSTYVAGQFEAYQKAGFRAVFMHFRGASSTPNRLPRAYHSGDTNDFDFLLKTLHAREPHTQKAAVGISLGGNVLLKWLGETGKQAFIHAAIAISPPFELQKSTQFINQGFSRIYERRLITDLKNLFKRKYQQHPEAIKPYIKNLSQLNSFLAFDETITAPLHGFKNARDYYQQSSCRAFLKHIKTPTLILHASDDPFMPQSVIPTADELSGHISLELSAKGGHVGFISGKIPGKPVYWLNARTPLFLSHVFAQT